MDKPTREQEELLKELAPHLDIMDDWYYSHLQREMSVGKTEEEAMGTASLLAILVGLTMSRGTTEIKENVLALTFAQEIFKIHIAVKKLLDLGLIEGRIKGLDEYGWPAYHITNVKETEL